MNELIQRTETMSSLEIAQVTNKRHKDVLEAIRKMEPAWVKVSGRNFPLTSYADAQGKPRPMYVLSKRECLYVATKFNDEARAKLVIRWEELERERQKQFQVPTTFREALLLAAEQQAKIEEQQKVIEIKDEQLSELTEKLTGMEPKAAFTDAVSASRSSCLIGELAKLLRQNGVETGEKRLFAWMRDNGYLGRYGERYNIPNQEYIERGYFELKMGTRSGNNGALYTTITTKVTGKGQVYFVNKLKQINYK